MPSWEAPCTELGSAPQATGHPAATPSPSEVSSASSPEPQDIRPSPLFRVLALPPPDPVQPPGQDELERRLPGYRRIVIPRDLTLIELLKQSSGVTTDEEVLHIREAKLRVLAERVGLRRLNILAPCLRSLTLDGSAISSLRDLGIGLVHLKFLSVARCGLTSLDGIWGLSSLRELNAARNRLQDLQPLAALQKLHTLNMAYNPIGDSSRLWMLGVCSALRKLTLEGTPASDEPDYRSAVAAALPMLISLDDSPLHLDFEDDLEVYEDRESSEDESPPDPQPAPAPDPEQGCSKTANQTSYSKDQVENESYLVPTPGLHSRRRPATTEAVGSRARAELPPRPKTAHGRPALDPPSRLEILNTLMDEEWRPSGSKLTSRGAVCGNLARALRRQGRAGEKVSEEVVEESGAVPEIISREIAEEIPRALRQDVWERFKKETGIDIDIDFTKCRPRSGDATLAIERLERIERETAERLANPDHEQEEYGYYRGAFGLSNYELWKVENRPSLLDPALTMQAVYRPIEDLVGQVNDLFPYIDPATAEESSPESLPE